MTDTPQCGHASRTQGRTSLVRARAGHTRALRQAGPLAGAKAGQGRGRQRRELLQAQAVLWGRHTAVAAWWLCAGCHATNEMGPPCSLTSCVKHAGCEAMVALMGDVPVPSTMLSKGQQSPNKKTSC